jgi:hypothetical protein
MTTKRIRVPGFGTIIFDGPMEGEEKFQHQWTKQDFYDYIVFMSRLKGYCWAQDFHLMQVFDVPMEVAKAGVEWMERNGIFVVDREHGGRRIYPVLQLSGVSKQMLKR